MFFSKIALALAVAAPLASALTIETPSGWTSGDPVTLTWQPVAGDPQSFSVELVNTAFNNEFGIANNVQTGSLSMNLTLPIVPVGDGYTLEFINVGNNSDIFATSGAFSIGATTSTSTSTASTSASTNGTLSIATTLSVASGSTSSFGVTVSGSATSAGSSTGSDTATSQSVSATNFNSGAVELGFSRAVMTGYAVMAAAAFAGARLVGF